MSIDECLDKCDPELREAIENVIDTAGTSEAHWWILEAAGNAVLAERSKWHDRLAERDAENAALKADVARLREMEREVRDLMAESRGVCGLHPNGDESSWDWLIDGGYGWLDTWRVEA